MCAAAVLNCIPARSPEVAHASGFAYWIRIRTIRWIFLICDRRGSNLETVVPGDDKPLRRRPSAAINRRFPSARIEYYPGLTCSDDRIEPFFMLNLTF